MIYSLSQ